MSRAGLATSFFYAGKLMLFKCRSVAPPVDSLPK